MSYCRWSSDNFACDLYCYADVNGSYTTHVAANKPVGDIPKVPPFGSVDLEEWRKAKDALSKFLDGCQRKPIGLPHDGATFRDADLDGLLATVLMLREAGYHCPDYVVTDIQAEIAGEPAP